MHILCIAAECRFQLHDAILDDHHELVKPSGAGQLAITELTNLTSLLFDINFDVILLVCY